MIIAIKKVEKSSAQRQHQRKNNVPIDKDSKNRYK